MESRYSGVIVKTILVLSFLILSSTISLSASDTEEINLGFAGTKICTPNQYSIDTNENAIYQCNNEGLKSNLVVDCDKAGNELEAMYTGEGPNGGYECAIDKRGTTTITLPIDAFQLYFLIIALFFLVFLLAKLFYSRKKSQDKA